MAHYLDVMNNDTFLTDHFTWAEAVRTDHRNVQNVIEAPASFENILRTAIKMEKVRAILGTPIIINSWYRCTALNRAIGGAVNSDHIRGAAVDFVSPKFGVPLEICKKLIAEKSLLGFKQLILEHTWVHISWDLIPNTIPKMEVLSLLESGGYARGLTDKQGNSLG